MQLPRFIKVNCPTVHCGVCTVAVSHSLQIEQKVLHIYSKVHKTFCKKNEMEREAEERERELHC